MANIRTPIYLYLPVHRGQHWQRDRRAEEQHCQRDRRAEEQYFQVLSLKLLLSVLGRALQISEDNARHFKSTISMQLKAQHFLLHRLSENSAKLSQRGAFCGYQ